MTNLEQQIAERLVTNALALGYTISVFDGEGYPVKQSTDKQKIIEGLQSTDEDQLKFRKLQTSEIIGTVLLIWGNGEDLISDHSDNEQINALVKSVY